MFKNFFLNSRNKAIFQKSTYSYFSSNTLTNKPPKEFWNEFSETYTTKNEFQVLPFYFNLINQLKVNEKNCNETILELAIGSGLGLKLLADLTEAKIIGGDFSENMLEKAKKRISLQSNNYRSKNIDLRLLNNEDLNSISSQSINYVISNLSLNLVDKPENMLKEVKRVLIPNGKAAFSIWGRPENNDFFTMIPKLMKKNGLNIGEGRSNFHMSKKDVCYKYCVDAGFKNVFLEYNDTIFNYENYEDLAYFIHSPNFSNILNSNPIEKKRSSFK